MAALTRTGATQLPPIKKTQFFRRFTRAGVTAGRECWEAETLDGVWVFVREESSGTPWLVRRRETGEIVAVCGTLRRARIAALRAVS